VDGSARKLLSHCSLGLSQMTVTNVYCKLQIPYISYEFARMVNEVTPLFKSRPINCLSDGVLKRLDPVDLLLRTAHENLMTHPT
jgi:hypothetical protein